MDKTLIVDFAWTRLVIIGQSTRGRPASDPKTNNGKLAYIEGAQEMHTRT